jgi:hypothetical protein
MFSLMVTIRTCVRRAVPLSTAFVAGRLRNVLVGDVAILLASGRAIEFPITLAVRDSMRSPSSARH